MSAAFALVIIGGSVHHARTFVWAHGIESVGRLQDHIDAPDEAWARIGEVLGELFGDDENPAIIATTAAGVIPFNARLPSVDMHGITDPWVARNGIRRDPALTNPGHYRDAPFAYLAERGVNLVVGHPWVEENKPGRRPAFGQHGLARFGIHDPPDKESLPEGAVMKVLEIELNDTHRLYVLYLMEDQRIDAVVSEKGIRRHGVLIRREPS